MPSFFKGEPDREATPVARPPTGVDLLLIPESVLQRTLTGLALGGPREMLCYWIGSGLAPRSDGRRAAIVTTAAFPKIYSSYDHFEVMEGQLGQINEWCADRDLWVLAQVHSHPTDEPHSQADECWPASHRVGFISVVIPFFGQQSSVRSPHWRVYECLGVGTWTQVDPDSRFQVIPDVWLPRS